MLSLPQPESTDEASEVKTSLPIVPVEEDSTTLDILLRDCYPGLAVQVVNLDILFKVLKAANKYQLRATVSRLEQPYISFEQGQIAKSPVDYFVYACHNKWGTLARKSAKLSLYFSIDQIVQQAEKVGIASHGDFFVKLLSYHYKCRVACLGYLSKMKTRHSFVEKAKEKIPSYDSLAFVDNVEALAAKEGAYSHGYEIMTIVKDFRSDINTVLTKTDIGLPF
ncbi:hypothetical protein ONZ45_g13067 [Pleurotus djamor]|nr:hypothetical protein ONZ45_g13067 [Pleurotus djamor]